MTKYTRRSFVKRTGSATLGAALGLGLLPSLTRKLHASDTSDPQGVKSQKPLALNATKIVPITDGSNQIGQMTLETTQTSSPAQSCLVSFAQTTTWKVTVAINIAGVAYSAMTQWAKKRVWICSGGGVVLSDDNCEPAGQSLPSGSLNITNASGQTCGTLTVATDGPNTTDPNHKRPAASVFPSAAKKDSPYADFPYLDPVLDCCPL
jgi:hypothetical protein